MHRLTLILILLALSATAQADTWLQFGPFQGADLSILGPAQRETIIQASEDFDLALKGKKPKHAILDDKAPSPADGGTAFFVGKDYKLTIIKSISTFGGAEGRLLGYVYGPVVRFEKSFAPGNMSEVESLRFYTSEQLKELMSNNQP